MKKISLIILVFIFCHIQSQVINRKFIEHLKKIAPFEVYEPEENKFRDWTQEEIKQLFTLQMPNIESIPRQKYESSTNDAYDFRTSHPECMLGIRDQERCGSCWSFGAISSLEERLCLKSGGKIKVPLSAQDPISCDLIDQGCSGGTPESAFLYLTNYGTVTEECWPYSSGNKEIEECRTTCKNGGEWKKYYASEFYVVSGYKNIKDDILANGPINTGMLVYEDFMSYKSGIYQYTSGEYHGGHSVVIVGWGNENGIDYWIVQNSWGPKWGEAGYFRIGFGEVLIDTLACSGLPAVPKA